MDFEEANKKVHPVETQWHYPIMTKYGYVAETKSAVGFVRSYKYMHPDGYQIIVTTGYSCDHWMDTTPNSGPINSGLWGELEPFLVKRHGRV